MSERVQQRPLVIKHSLGDYVDCPGVSISLVMVSQDSAFMPEPVPMSIAPLQHEPAHGSWLETHDEHASSKGTFKVRLDRQTSGCALA